MNAFLEGFREVISENTNKKVFGENADQITYFITMSDDENAGVIEEQSARALNPERIFNEFIEREEF